MPPLIDLAGLPRETQWAEYYRLMEHGELHALVAIGLYPSGWTGQEIAWSAPDNPDEWSPTHV